VLTKQNLSWTTENWDTDVFAAPRACVGDPACDATPFHVAVPCCIKETLPHLSHGILHSCTRTQRRGYESQSLRDMLWNIFKCWPHIWVANNSVQSVIRALWLNVRICKRKDGIEQESQLSLTCRQNARANVFARNRNATVSITYPQHLTPSMTGSPRATGMRKLEWRDYNLVKVAWWSTQLFGHNTSKWQTHRQPHRQARRHSNSRRNALRSGGKNAIRLRFRYENIPTLLTISLGTPDTQVQTHIMHRYIIQTLQSHMPSTESRERGTLY